MALLFFLFAALPALAEPPEDIQKAIDAKSEEIKRLEEEAQKYRGALDELEERANTLEAEVERRNRAVKRLEASIRLTNVKISRTNLEIEALARGIQEKTAAIERGRGELGHLVAVLAASETQTPLEVLIQHGTISVFFTSLDALRGIQQGLKAALETLRQAQVELADQKTRNEQKRLELAALADELQDQKALQEQERRERSTLLAETKNQERRYQELLGELERKREALEEELKALESGLASTFDRSILPAPGSGILSWPLPAPIFITQYFGRTTFARSGAYRGQYDYCEKPEECSHIRAHILEKKSSGFK